MVNSSVTLADGKIVSGPDVRINEQTERWSDVTLDDGTVLRVKPNVFSVVRVDGEYDTDDNPLYAIRTNIVMTVASVLPHMKKGAAGAAKAN